MHLSEKLQLLAADKGLTQEEIGASLGVAHTSVGRWMAGKSRPYARHAIRLAQIFGIPVRDLLDDSFDLRRPATFPELDPIIEHVVNEDPEVQTQMLTAWREIQKNLDFLRSKMSPAMQKALDEAAILGRQRRNESSHAAARRKIARAR